MISLHLFWVCCLAWQGHTPAPGAEWPGVVLGLRILPGALQGALVFQVTSSALDVHPSASLGKYILPPNTPRVPTSLSPTPRLISCLLMLHSHVTLTMHLSEVVHLSPKYNIAHFPHGAYLNLKMI